MANIVNKLEQADATKQFQIPPNSYLFSITRGSDSYHFYCCYNNTTGTKK